MRAREPFIDFIKGIGFRYDRETKHSTHFRRGNDPIYVPKRRLDDLWIRSTLRQHGVAEQDITTFLNACEQ